ncbi:MAG: DUF2334 domain-containing protein, partial [Ignavibacteria bacterium]|nr:DUF2334 domain-containing protein [Ignavibacteria bacterium]
MKKINLIIKSSAFAFTIFSLLLIESLVLESSKVFADEVKQKKVLILAEGETDLKNFAIAEARQLANLLGHFNVDYKIKGVNQYFSNELSNYDYTFYIGFNIRNQVPDVFLNNIFSTRKEVIWLNTGMLEFSSKYDLKNQFGFEITSIDSTSGFDKVISEKKQFTKGDEHTAIIKIFNKNLVKVIATAISSKSRTETPYIIKSKNLLYVTDSPFAYANETDRYLLFADMLHEILNEPHEESHYALLRIEDISPMDDPIKLREIADCLASKEIPFLVGVSPFYVNPNEGLRVSLSEKPEMVDALKYMVRNG